MNKKQLVNKIASTLSQSKADAERTFDTITQIILDCLKSDEAVKIAGFGTYKVAKRKARIEQRRAKKSNANPKVSEQDTMHDINKPITLEDLTNPDKN